MIDLIFNKNSQKYNYFQFNCSGIKWNTYLPRLDNDVDFKLEVDRRFCFDFGNNVENFAFGFNECLETSVGVRGSLIIQ